MNGSHIADWIRRYNVAFEGNSARILVNMVGEQAIRADRAERLLQRARRELSENQERREEEGQKRSEVVDALLRDIDTPARSCQ